jgi:hypothetical protein
MKSFLLKLAAFAFIGGVAAATTTTTVRAAELHVMSIPVASVVANSDYELGFQQVSEFLPVPGVTFVGKIPAPVVTRTGLDPVTQH